MKNTKLTCWVECDNEVRYITVQSSNYEYYGCWNVNENDLDDGVENFDEFMDRYGEIYYESLDNYKLGIHKNFDDYFGLDKDSPRVIAENSILHYSDYKSDKVYQAQLVNEGTEWSVYSQYGRRGTDLKEDIKCQGEDYLTAKKVYDKLVDSKIRKGYVKII